jgi:hypothetical protein
MRYAYDGNEVKEILHALVKTEIHFGCNKEVGLEDFTKHKIRYMFLSSERML